MRKITSIFILFLFCLAITLTAGHNVYRTDGTVYKNVENLQSADDFYFFDKNGKSYSLPKHRIQRITKQNGETVYEQQNLKVTLAPDDANEYIFYRNDVEVGRGKWLDAGKFLVTDGDIPDGVYKEFHDSGELKRTFSIRDGSLNGPCKVFYRSGKVERAGVFKNGNEEGKSTLFYPAGELKGFSYYLNGKKSGPTKLYYESGQIKATLNFKDGRPDGEQVMYYDNGKPASKVVYDDGEKEGPVTFYYESGKIKMQGKYVNDALDGTVTTYYESGRVKKRETFNNGRILQK
jgi:antitoxin component YwqK of YwqJK toxin-antitoxin module